MKAAKEQEGGKAVRMFGAKKGKFSEGLKKLLRAGNGMRVNENEVKQ